MKRHSVWVVLLLAAATRVWALDANDPAIVGLWLADEGNGDVLKDSSPNGNDGQINGNFDWVAGKFGKAIHANGGGSIDVEVSDSINSISTALTVVTWVNVDKDSDTGIRRQNAFLLEDQSATEPVPDGWSFRIWTSDGLSPGVYSSAKIKQGEWHHVAGVWDGSVMSLYIDGTPDPKLLTDKGADTDGKWGGKIGQPGDKLQLKYSSESYTGALDEIIIFNRALSADEIKALAEKGWEGALAVEPTGKLTTTWGSLKSR